MVLITSQLDSYTCNVRGSETPDCCLIHHMIISFTAWSQQMWILLWCRDSWKDLLQYMRRCEGSLQKERMGIIRNRQHQTGNVSKQNILSLSPLLFLKPFMFLICNLFSYFSHFLCNSIKTAIPEPFNFSVSGKVGKTNFKSRKMKAV